MWTKIYNQKKVKQLYVYGIFTQKLVLNNMTIIGGLPIYRVVL